MKVASIASMVVVLILAIAGCERDEVSSTSAPTTKTELPPGLLLTVAPPDEKSVTDIRTSAKDGDVVIVRGWVGGSVEPIADNRAIFTLVDQSLPSCSVTEGDTCPTPWDSCCEPAETITAKSLTVQVVDAGGSPLRTGLRGAGGLEPMKEVVVTGELHLSPDGKAGTIDATGLHVMASSVK